METFFKAKLELLSVVEEEVDIKLRKAKEMSGWQDYTSSFFTPEHRERSQRKTQQFDVNPFSSNGGGKKRKNEKDSSRENGKKFLKAKSLPLSSCSAHSSKSHVGTTQRIDPVEDVKEEGKGKWVITHDDDLVEETSSK